MKCKYSLSSTILAPSRETEGWNASQKGQREQEKLYRANKQNKMLLHYPDCRSLRCSELTLKDKELIREERS